MKTEDHQKSPSFVRYVFLAGVSASIAMLFFVLCASAELITPQTPFGVDSFIEMDDTEAREMIAAWGEDLIFVKGALGPRIDQARSVLFFQLAFVILAPLTLLAGCIWIISGCAAGSWLRKIGIGIAILQPAAAVLGLLENLEIRKIMSGAAEAGNHELAYATWWAKIALASLATLYIVAGFVSWRVREQQNAGVKNVTRGFLNLLFLERIPLIFLLVMQALAVLGAIGGSTFQNAMITESVPEMVILAGQIVGCAVISYFSLWSIWSVASHRFGIKLAGTAVDSAYQAKNRITAALLLSLPLLTVVVYRNEFGKDGTSDPVLASLAALIGVIVSLATYSVARITLANSLNRLLSKMGIVRLISRLLGDDCESDASGARSRAHSISLATAILLGALYITGYYVLHPETGIEAVRDVVSPLAYVLGLLVLLSVVLSGLTLMLDRYRLPLLISLVIWSIGVYWLKSSDHYFTIYRSQDGAREPAAFKTAVQARLDRQKTGDSASGEPKKVVTLVCASGGGIQAAAWTAQVLTGLSSPEWDDPDEFSDRFSRSIHLISSTSGGSVGSLQYLESIDRSTGLPRQEALEQVVDSASAPSLREVFWGLTYPDFLRVFSPVRLWNPNTDRAWAVEQAWGLSADQVWGSEQGPRAGRISEWMTQTEAGTLPAAVMNATVVNDGQQIAISTLKYPNKARFNDRLFSTLYNKNIEGEAETPDLSKVSAARLSATFPYITPAARGRYDEPKSHEDSPNAYYLADGGYFDNNGAVAAVEWARAAMADRELRAQIDKIVILVILAFPDSDANDEFDAKGARVASNDQAEEPGGAKDTDLNEVQVAAPAPTEGAGWFYDFVGPISALANVRSSTQVARSRLEIGLLKDQFPEVIVPVVVQPNRFPSGYAPPLSWQLSKRDNEYIEASWDAERPGIVKILNGAFVGKPAAANPQN